MLRLVFASLHLLALGIGLGAVWARGSALRGSLDAPGVRRVLVADTWWGVAALLWVGTGLVRLLAGVEKSTAYYLHNHLFWLKMALLGVILALEIAPMVALIRWRATLTRGGVPETSRAGRYSTISLIQALVVAAMVPFAVAIARGYGH